MPTELADRNARASERAREGRHQARLVDGHLRVVSHTLRGQVWYDVTAHTTEAGRPVTFACSPVDRHGCYVAETHRYLCATPGVTGCRHSATAARRLRREGFIRVDRDTGLWVATAKACPPTADDDPFNGLV